MCTGIQNGWSRSRNLIQDLQVGPLGGTVDKYCALLLCSIILLPLSYRVNVSIFALIEI